MIYKNTTLKELIENGFSITKAAKKLNINILQAKQETIQNGYTLKREKFSDDKIPEIVELYKEGVSAKELGKKFSIDKRRVQKWVKENGCLRTLSQSHRLTYFNENYFDEINTKEKAYWLGFFYADAYNCCTTNTFNLTLSGKDINHLQKIALLVELPLEKVILNNVTMNDKEYSTANLKLYSKHICTQMTKLGCPRAKSFIIRYPQWLKKDFDNHFIRGLFDGDGCLSYRKKQKEWKWSLVSTRECCRSIQTIIKENTGKLISYENISKTGNNTYNLSSGGNEKIRTITDWLYQDSYEYCRLDRKYNMYLSLCSQQNARKIGREKYNITSEIKSKIINSNEPHRIIGDKYGVHRITVGRIKKAANKL